MTTQDKECMRQHYPLPLPTTLTPAQGWFPSCAQTVGCGGLWPRCPAGSQAAAARAPSHAVTAPPPNRSSRAPRPGQGRYLPTMWALRPLSASPSYSQLLLPHPTVLIPAVGLARDEAGGRDEEVLWLRRVHELGLLLTRGVSQTATGQPVAHSPPQPSPLATSAHPQTSQSSHPPPPPPTRRARTLY